MTGGLKPAVMQGHPWMRKVIEFDDETWQALVQLGRDRMATLQELADESFADLLKKHGVPKDLKDALRRSAKAAKKNGKPASRTRRR
jgi:non-homologous end joining protein Ku